MKNSLNRLLTGIACTALIAGLSVPAHAAQAQPEPYTISIQADGWDLIRCGRFLGRNAGRRSGVLATTGRNDT